jgi:hypothetical protein
MEGRHLCCINGNRASVLTIRPEGRARKNGGGGVWSGNSVVTICYGEGERTNNGNDNDDNSDGA